MHNQLLLFNFSNNLLDSQFIYIDIDKLCDPKKFNK
jgi:hypothetical protein